MQFSINPGSNPSLPSFQMHSPRVSSTSSAPRPRSSWDDCHSFSLITRLSRNFKRKGSHSRVFAVLGNVFGTLIPKSPRPFLRQKSDSTVKESMCTSPAPDELITNGFAGHTDPRTADTALFGFAFGSNRVYAMKSSSPPDASEGESDRRPPPQTRRQNPPKSEIPSSLKFGNKVVVGADKRFCNCTCEVEETRSFIFMDENQGTVLHFIVSVLVNLDRRNFLRSERASKYEISTGVSRRQLSEAFSNSL